MSRPWMPFYVSDYLGDTRHLSTLEHGAYLLLIFHYWQRGSLPDDDGRLATIAGLSAEEWGRRRSTLAEMFSPGWKHHRIEKELAAALSKSDKARAAAQASWEARGRKAADAHATADANASAPADAPAMLSTTTMIASPSLRSGEASAAARDDIDRLEERCRQAAGLTNAPHPGLLNLAPILALLRDGFELEADIVPVLRAKAAGGHFGRSWSFYVEAIKESRDKANALCAAGKFDAARSRPRANAPTFFVRLDSPEWAEWCAYESASGRKKPVAMQTKNGMGKFFHTALPPGAVRRTG